MPIARHKPYRILTANCLALTLIPLALSHSVADPPELAGALHGWTLALYAAAAISAAQVTFSFDRGAPQRAAWLLLALGYVTLFAARFAAGPSGAGLVETWPSLGPLTSAASIAASGLGIWAFLLLARAWRRSGLDLDGPAQRLGLTIAALAVSGALAGPDLLEALPGVLRGDPAAIADAVTDLIDVAMLVVAAPVVRAAVSLGGGVLRWPWILLTLSVAGWLGYDAVATWGDVTLGLSPRAVRVGEEMCRTLACVSLFGAGAAQRWVMSAAPGTDTPAEAG